MAEPGPDHEPGREPGPEPGLAGPLATVMALNVMALVLPYITLPLALHLTPYALHLTPYALHLTPYTLHHPTAWPIAYLQHPSTCLTLHHDHPAPPPARGSGGLGAFRKGQMRP